MTTILMSAAGIGVVLGLIFLFLFKSLLSGKRTEALPENLDSLFTAARYKPMERLLDPLDYEFLAAQPSYCRSMGRKFRASRITIFRSYARLLGRDFTRVSNALKILMVHASIDRSSLAGLLLKQRILFQYAMMSLEVKLVLHRFGWSAPGVDVRELISALDAMGAQLRVLSLAVQPSAA